MKPPKGIDEIRKLYGDPRQMVRVDGTVSPIWEARMTMVQLPTPLPLGWDRNNFATRARVNVAIADEVADVFRDLEWEGAWRLLRTYDGAYTFRLSRGGSKLSMHSFGGAIDFDATWNKLGTQPSMPKEVIRVFKRRGWTWGGEWKRRDGMHFQFGKGY